MSLGPMLESFEFLFGKIRFGKILFDTIRFIKIRSAQCRTENEPRTQHAKEGFRLHDPCCSHP